MSDESSQKDQSATAVAEEWQREDRAPWEQQQWLRESESREDGSAKKKKQTDALQSLRQFRVEFGPGAKDILSFTNQPLESIAGQTENQKFKVIIFDLKNRIEAGQSFSQALAEHPQVFTDLYVNMVGAAEISGSLSGMLQKLAEYLDSEAETRSQVRGAMVYPIIIATMAVLVTVFLLCFVLPRFTAIFAGKEHLLPTPTKVLMASCCRLRQRF
ncbi:MAG: type II secretion system F family protein [Planctomycetota bacterium]|jgi:type II secretory pathway component PulF